MSRIYLHSGKVYNTGTETFEKNNLVIENGKIAAFDRGDEYADTCDQTIDMSGKLIIPSYIDIHTHGALKLKFQRHTKEEYQTMFGHYTATGTASVFPTISTDHFDAMLEATKVLCELSREDDTINIDCIHYEGPFLSHEKKGAHNENLLQNPNIDFIKHALKITGDDIKIRVTIAPELDGALEFIKECTELGVMTAIGHTNTDFETAKKAIELGADSFIHTYNAMSPLGHRDPGVVGAALYCENAYPELICDGFHVSRVAASILYHARPNNIVLVSDSIQAAGIVAEDGYSFGSQGLEVFIVGGQARLADGTIAGSRLDMHTAVRNLSEFADIPFERALVCATKHPAVLCGIYDKTGSIEVGKRADINILSEDYGLEQVYVAGKRVK